MHVSGISGIQTTGKVAFIGTGTMGLPMVRNLAKAGIAVTAFDARKETRMALAAEGIATAETIAGAAAEAQAAITMLPDTPDVRAVFFGDGGLATALPSGALAIDMSTIAPAAAVELGEHLAGRGVAFVDAPVSGGVTGAEGGTLSIMVGGEEAAFARAKPLLMCMGKTVLHAGPFGSGQVFKACNQLMVASHIQAMCEALALGRAHGADLPRLLAALRGGAAGSWMLDNLAPKVLARDASAGFRIDLMLKDLKLANDAAFAKGVPLPGLALATALYLEARAHGEGSNGNQALFRTFDRMTNQEGLAARAAPCLRRRPLGNHRRAPGSAIGDAAHRILKACAPAEIRTDVEMLEQQAVCTIGMAIDHGGQDQSVVVDEEIVDALDVHDQFATLGMGAAKELGDRGIDDRQGRRMGRSDQRGMKGVIRLAAAHRILDRLDDPLESEAKAL